MEELVSMTGVARITVLGLGLGQGHPPKEGVSAADIEVALCMWITSSYIIPGQHRVPYGHDDNDVHVRASHLGMNTRWHRSPY